MSTKRSTQVNGPRVFHCNATTSKSDKMDIDSNSLELNISKMKNKIAALEIRNQELINTRNVETEQLRRIVEKFRHSGAVKDKQIVELRGMLMDRDGEVQRLRRILDDEDGIWQEAKKQSVEYGESIVSAHTVTGNSADGFREV